MNCTTCDQLSNCQHQTGAAVPGFPLRSFLCSQSAIIQKLILPNLGYILDMKSREKTESFFILGYLLELIIKIWRFGKTLFEIWRIWVFFFTKYPLCRSKSFFSGENFAKFTSKRNCSAVQSNWKLLSSRSAVVEEWLTEGHVEWLTKGHVMYNVW